MKEDFEGTLTDWEYTGSKTTVGPYEGTRIGAKNLTMNSITDVASGGFQYNYAVENLYLEGYIYGVANITAKTNAFTNCPKLKTITFGGVTSDGIVPTQDFMGDTDLQSITFVDTTNKIKEVGNNSFQDCSALTTIDLSGCTKVGQVAFRNTGFTTLSLPELITLGGQYCFADCTKLTSFSAPKLTALQGYTFSGCTNLTDVNLPLLKNLGNAGQAFSGCRWMTEIKLPAIETWGSLAPFDGCRRLDIIDTGLNDSTNYTSINRVISGTNALRHFVIRRTSMVALATSPSNAFGSLVNSGYVYVPSNLLSTYQAATNWSTLAAARWRALEDYTVDGTITGDLDPSKI